MNLITPLNYTPDIIRDYFNHCICNIRKAVLSEHETSAGLLYLGGIAYLYYEDLY
jgi:hypothetical protein